MLADTESGTRPFEASSNLPASPEVDIPDVPLVSFSLASDKGNSQHLTEQKCLSGIRLALSLLCMSFLTFITSIDTTIVGTAYIPIGSHFNGADRAEWIINSYLIAVAAFQPIYGKVSDIIGRVEAITIAISIFMLGSIISAVSTSLNMLIAGRVVQGIGGAGFMNMSRIVLGDISSKQDRGKYFSAITCAYGVGVALGPVIGGLIVEYSKWQVIFWINIPICVVVAAVVNIILKLPHPDGTWKEKVRRIDFGGSFLSIVGIVLVLLALSWGGREYRWSSAAVICSFVFGLVVIVVFILYEWKVAPLPIVPIHMFGIWNVSVSSISQIFQAAGFYGPVTFIPQWALLSRHASTITSGLYLLPFAITTIFATAGSGVLNSRTGRCREFIWAGTALLTLGNGLLILLAPDSNVGKIIGFVTIAGIGFGLCFQKHSIIAQVSVQDRDMAAVSAMNSFFISLGGILTVSIINNVVQNRLHGNMESLGSQFPEYASTVAHIMKDPSAINSVDIPNQLNIAIQQAYSAATRYGFIVITALTSLSFLLSLGLKRV